MKRVFSFSLLLALITLATFLFWSYSPQPTSGERATEFLSAQNAWLGNQVRRDMDKLLKEADKEVREKLSWGVGLDSLLGAVAKFRGHVSVLELSLTRFRDLVLVDEYSASFPEERLEKILEDARNACNAGAEAAKKFSRFTVTDHQTLLPQPVDNQYLSEDHPLKETPLYRAGCMHPDKWVRKATIDMLEIAAFQKLLYYAGLIHSLAFQAEYNVRDLKIFFEDIPEGIIVGDSFSIIARLGIKKSDFNPEWSSNAYVTIADEYGHAASLTGVAKKSGRKNAEGNWVMPINIRARVPLERLDSSVIMEETVNLTVLPK